MSEGEGTLVDKSESSSFEDLAAAAAQEIEEAKLAEAAAAKEKSDTDETKTDEWQDVLGSGALLKKVRQECDYESRHYILHIYIFLLTNPIIEYHCYKKITVKTSLSMLMNISYC